MLTAVGVFGAATIVFGFSRWMPLSLACLALLGGADMFSVYVRQSLIQLYTPDEMRGRVGAVSSLFISASNELGEAESGFLGALIGPVTSVIAGGFGAIAVVLLWSWWFPELRLAKTSTRPICAGLQAPLEESLGMKADTILETIGNTPHVRINRLFGPTPRCGSSRSGRTPARRSRTASRCRWSRMPSVAASSSPAA